MINFKHKFNNFSVLYYVKFVALRNSKITYIWNCTKKLQSSKSSITQTQK